MMKKPDPYDPSSTALCSGFLSLTNCRHYGIYSTYTPYINGVLLTRTIALSDEAFEKLRRLKERTGAGSYSELVAMLVEEYEKSLMNRLKKLLSELKLKDREVDEIVNIVNRLRGRRWF